MAIAKTFGSGWHSQSIRHSNARKYGVAGGTYANMPRIKPYQQLILNQTPNTKYSTDWILIPCGKCQFCGHRSESGYRITNKETKESMIVGTDCIFTLMNLDKRQQAVLKEIDEKQRHDNKYARLKEYLLEKHKDELVSLQQASQNINNTRYEIKKQDEDYVYYDLIDEKTGKLLRSDKMPVDAWQEKKETFTADEGYNFPKTPNNLASIILNKISRTRSNINKYWLDEYEKATGVSLKDFLKKK